MKNTAPPPQRRRSARDLELAYDLRPRDIVALHGISTSSLCHYATKLPDDQRPISHLIRGRNGRKGIRLFPKVAFAAWRACYDSTGQFDAARWAVLRRQFSTEGGLLPVRRDGDRRTVKPPQLTPEDTAWLNAPLGPFRSAK